MTVLTDTLSNYTGCLATSVPCLVQHHPSYSPNCLQIAKADLQKIAASLSQAQGVYKALKAKRAELNKAVEALRLMSDWQVWLLG